MSNQVYHREQRYGYESRETTEFSQGMDAEKEAYEESLYKFKGG